MEIIVAAAILSDDGMVFMLPKPKRHHDIAHMLTGLVTHSKKKVQGFVTSTGRFVDRKEGARIALRSGQLEKLTTPPNLYTEDLW